LLLVIGIGFFSNIPSSFIVHAETSAPKPSVPQFTVRLVAYPYDVPTTTTTKIDQYTGKEIITSNQGYHVENRSVEILINNQPFTPYTDDVGYEINLYYQVRIKGHFGEDWEYFYDKYQASDFPHPLQSNSEYTLLSLPADYPNDAQVDFQVEAILGYYYDELAGRPILPLYALRAIAFSDWSNTQTLTINDENVQIKENKTIPEFSLSTMLPLLMIGVIAVLILKKL
jgi:hypothetical protein